MHRRLQQLGFESTLVLNPRDMDPVNEALDALAAERETPPSSSFSRATACRTAPIRCT